MKVKHIVLIKLAGGCTDEQIADCFDELAGLRNQLAGIESFSGGKYSSPEGLNRGFTHGFEIIFSNEKARDDYLAAPAHVKAAEKLLALTARENNELQLIAFDYLLKNGY